MSHGFVVALAYLSAITGCSYGVSFADCEVTCQGSGADVCPDGFTCTAGMCRVEGAGSGACMAPGQTTLRQTADDKPERSLVFGCTNPDSTTAAGSWYRVYSLPQSGVIGSFSVDHVTLGICFAMGAPMVTIKVGTYSGGAADPTLDLSKVQMLQSADEMIAETQISKTVDVPVKATIPAGANLIVEIAIPDLNGTSQEVNMGFTTGSEMKPGYVRSPLCGPGTATTTTGAGLPNARLVLTVTGS
jgi:hypothetical protein